MSATEVAAGLPNCPVEWFSSICLVTDWLRSQDAVTGIWLFGSLAKGRTPDWRSDIDIAIKGLEPTALGGVWSELDARIPQPLDLVRWEDASPALRGEIARTGRVLYEA